jgi:purine-nucleoside phosphorylase
MLRSLGADVVGMSVALEAIAAKQARMDVLGLSLITNQAAGISPTPLSHREVLEAGAEAEPRISALLAKILEKI